MFNKIKNSPYLKDSEFQQAVIRILFGISLTLYIGIGMSTHYYPAHFLEYKIFATGFFLYSTLTITSVIIFPNVWYRRYLTTAIDIFCLCYAMLLTGAGPFSAYFLIFPWIFISNGVRYGKTSLTYTTIISTISFSTVVLMTGSGYSHYIEASAYFLFLLILPFYINIMLKREMEERAEKERALNTRNEFLATISHEIRTPMSGIIGMTTLLERTELNEQQREYISSLHNTSSILHSLINDILDLSKLEAQKIQLDLLTVNLRKVINSVIQIFTPQAKAKNIQLDCQIQNIPEIIRTDKNKLRQILLNLISNAIKFTQSGSVLVKITGNKKDNDLWNIKFEIIDTGSGIKQKDIPRVFEAFYQCNKTSNLPHQGTGLGTTISKELVGLMGGEIGLSSNSGIGSTFWFQLPLLEITSNSQSIDLPSTTTAQISKPLNILVAEDDLINAKVITTFLKDEGHTVDLVNNGEEAISKLTTAKYDLVFMDMRMPITNGPEAAKKWRQLEKGDSHIPIIALTANASSADRQLCLDSGMDDFLIKPVSAEQLNDVIQKHN